ASAATPLMRQTEEARDAKSLASLFFGAWCRHAVMRGTVTRWRVVRSRGGAWPRCAVWCLAPRQVDGPRGGSAALAQRHVVALWCSGVDLPRPADALLRVLHHLLPLADPANSARHREQRGEHAGREAHRLENDTGIEIHVRVQLALDKVLVVQCDL